MPPARRSPTPPPTSATRRPRFGLTLAAIAASYVVVIAAGAALTSGPLRIALLGLVLFATVRLHTRTVGWTRAAAVAVAVMLVAATVACGTGSASTTVVLSSLAIMLLVTASIASLGQYLWRSPTVDRQSVGAALAVYLLLAQLFASVHQLLAVLLGPPYLDGAPNVADAATYLYFSVITLTTVGYGDVAPACRAAQAVAITEALSGQLYLVAIVGAVVGSWAGQPRPNRDGERPAGKPDRPS